jgi:hypothetical protein
MIPMDTNYRIAYNKGWLDLKQKDPLEVSMVMNVSYWPAAQQFTVPFLNKNYLVDLKQETIICQADGETPGIEAAILLLHYLSFFQTTAEPANTWVSLKEIPNGGSLFYPAFHQTAILSLIKAFGQQPELLLKFAPILGGQAAVFGDASAIFQVFPKIPLCVVIWEGDEEIAANATLLFDPSIAHFLHIESVIGLGGYLAKKLVKLASQKNNQ